MQFVIEDGVPIPGTTGSARDGTLDVLRQLEPGQSVLFSKHTLSWATCALRKETGRKFRQQRIGPKSIRVWRLA